MMSKTSKNSGHNGHLSSNRQLEMWSIPLMRVASSRHNFHFIKLSVTDAFLIKKKNLWDMSRNQRHIWLLRLEMVLMIKTWLLKLMLVSLSKVRKDLKLLESLTMLLVNLNFWVFSHFIMVVNGIVKTHNLLLITFSKTGSMSHL